MLANKNLPQDNFISPKDLLSKLNSLTCEIINYDTKAFTLRRERKAFEEKYKKELEIIKEYI